MVSQGQLNIHRKDARNRRCKGCGERKAIEIAAQFRYAASELKDILKKARNASKIDRSELVWEFYEWAVIDQISASLDITSGAVRDAANAYPDVGLAQGEWESARNACFARLLSVMDKYLAIFLSKNFLGMADKMDQTTQVSQVERENAGKSSEEIDKDISEQYDIDLRKVA